MYRKLQELGHKVVFLIGDFTTQIGDPTGRNKTRPIIPIEEIQHNAGAFISQAMMVLHDDKDLVEIRKNSEWYDSMSAKELLSLMSAITHDRLISRDMFRKRVKEGKEIYENELVYPILQGFDSVKLHADMTIIGSDQLFNEMMGRSFQDKFQQDPQVVITTKITPGIDGKEKQSKSLGNFIGLSHSPKDKFGRIMSIPDNLIIEYFKVYTEVPIDEITKIEKQSLADPMKYKLRLAEEIVSRYHGKKSALEESQYFSKTFSEKVAPEDAPIVVVGANQISVFDLLRKCYPVEKKSNSDLRRLVEQKAIKVNGKVVTHNNYIILVPDTGVGLKVGKKDWFRISN
jgi:tyrosyl-tRNA synthetase